MDLAAAAGPHDSVGSMSADGMERLADGLGSIGPTRQSDVRDSELTCVQSPSRGTGRYHFASSSVSIHCKADAER